jgi:hypothetical protein
MSSTAPSSSSATTDLNEKNQQQLSDMRYRQRLVVNNLQNDLFAEINPDDSQTVAADLMDAQQRLYTIEETLAVAESSRPEAAAAPASDTIFEEPILESMPTIRGFQPSSATPSGNKRSFESTGVEVAIDSYMEHLPTAFYHLLNDKDTPLVTCTVSTNMRGIKRLRVISFIEGYTAKAVDTVEVRQNTPQTVKQLPSLFPREISGLNELTRATLNVQVEDLDTNKILEHRTEGIWLLARTTAPRSVKDAVTGEITDFSPYLAAFVTPNEPSVMKFLRTVVRRHHQHRLQGYLGDVESQVQAIYEALKEDLDIAYVHSVVNFNLEDNTRSQRIRLPRECIDGKMGNCIDATLLFASLLESISLNPVVALVPGHAFVGWQTATDENEWQYLETTMLQTNTFFEARDVGTERAVSYRQRAESSGNEAWFKPLFIGQLRTQKNITPME